jgi:hypothetical protein
MGTGSLNGKTATLLQALAGAVIAGLVAYFTAQNTTNERLTKVETQSDERWLYVQSSLTRIENNQNVDRNELRRILQDWANGIDRRTGEPLPLQRSIEQGR